MEIDGFPIKNGDFPYFFVNVYQRVIHILGTQNFRNFLGASSD